MVIVPFVGGPEHGQRFYFSDANFLTNNQEIKDLGGTYRLVSLPYGKYYYKWAEDHASESLTGGSAENHTPSLPSVSVP